MANKRVNTAAVIGAGMAGAACAAGLRDAGFAVTVFDKSRGVGGRMATRRLDWCDAGGVSQTAEFDHGTHHFLARRPRFRALLANAEAAGHVATWRPHVHSLWPGPTPPCGYVATPGMPALARHLLQGAALVLDTAIVELRRRRLGWQLRDAGGAWHGPFDRLMLALPAPQTATLLAGQHADWAARAGAIPIAACWTLMAITDEVDWAWDAAVPDRDPLAWVSRNDRKPLRPAVPGAAYWVAHASPEWSATRLELPIEAVRLELVDALSALLPNPEQVRWHHSAVHRWRYAAPTQVAQAGQDCWWDNHLGLGVCGDFFSGGDVEAAWHSGDELADVVAADADAAALRPPDPHAAARRTRAPATARSAG